MNLAKRVTLVNNVCIRFFSSNSNRDVILRRAALFEEEKSRQLKEIERIDKIEVKILEPGKETTLMMNKNLSTPYHCALHLSELYAKRSALARINDDKVWDMHKPLEDNCTIKFLHFKDAQPENLNLAFWRSCAFLLGYVLESSFKNDFFVELCTNPQSTIKNGCFLSDVKLNVPNWIPGKDELRCLSVGATKIINQNLDFQRIEVAYDVAQDVFKYNKYKSQQLNHLASQNENAKLKVSLYKLGDFVDFETGPLIANTSQIGRFEIAAAYNHESNHFGTVQRFQGIAIPSQLKLHYWTYNLLAERAAKIPVAVKTKSLPQSDKTESTKRTAVASN